MVDNAMVVGGGFDFGKGRGPEASWANALGVFFGAPLRFLAGLWLGSVAGIAEAEPRKLEVGPTVLITSERGELRLGASQPRITYYLFHGPRFVDEAFLHRRTLPDFERICTAPCTASLPVGRYRLALAQDSGPPRVASGGTIDVTATPTYLHGEYQSRAGVRAAGWVSLVMGSLLVGAGAAVMESEQGGTGRNIHDASGGAVMAIGSGAVLALVGMILALVQDDVKVSQRPVF